MEVQPTPLRPPIPEPGAPVDEGGIKFFVSLWPPFSLSLVANCVEVAVILWPVLPRMSLLARTNLGLVLIAVAALAAVATCAMGVVRVDEGGLAAHDAWGRRRRLRWHEITRIRPRRILNLRYLMLHAERGAPLWLPLFLRDRDGFGAAIHHHAPSDHALRAALQLPPR